LLRAPCPCRSNLINQSGFLSTLGLCSQSLAGVSWGLLSVLPFFPYLPFLVVVFSLTSLLSLSNCKDSLFYRLAFPSPTNGVVLNPIESNFKFRVQLPAPFVRSGAQASSSGFSYIPPSVSLTAFPSSGKELELVLHLVFCLFGLIASLDIAGFLSADSFS
jgi:hypothetical protein